MTEQETWWADALAKANAERDAVQAEATLLRRALIGRRHFPAGVMRTPMDERTEAIRARWDEFCFSGPSETDRERDQVIGWLLDRMDSATARAEQAEAALAEMRERLGTASGLPSLHRDDEIVLRYLDGTEHRLRITEAKAVEPGSMEVSAEPATPRTALERAADEQGDGEGGGDA